MGGGGAMLFKPMVQPRRPTTKTPDNLQTRYTENGIYARMMVKLAAKHGEDKTVLLTILPKGTSESGKHRQKMSVRSYNWQDQ